MRSPSLPSLPPPSLTLPPPSVSARARRPIGRDRSQTHACVGAGCVSSHVCVLACMFRMHTITTTAAATAAAALSVGTRTPPGPSADACMCARCERARSCSAMRPRPTRPMDLIWAASHTCIVLTDVAGLSTSCFTQYYNKRSRGAYTCTHSERALQGAGSSSRGRDESGTNALKSTCY